MTTITEISSKERFVRACSNLPVDRPPVWMMRQAGRTLKEYLQIREKYSFWEVCKTPELAAEVTLQPLKRYPVDAAVVFSDILVIPDAMGLDVSFKPKLTVSPPVKTMDDVNNLEISGIQEKLHYVPELLKILNKEIGSEKAILGFSGAPYTLACYLIEGGSNKYYSSVRKIMNSNPKLFSALMNKLTAAVTDYMLMQVDAGVTAVQLFDSWAGDLSAEDFDIYVLPHVQKLVSDIHKSGVSIIYYINGTGNLLESMKKTGADVISVDWRVTLKNARSRLGNDTVLQGNLDPTALYAPEEEIRKKVNDMIRMTGGQGHIVNLGHGLLPGTPMKGIEMFVRSVTEWENGKE